MGRGHNRRVQNGSAILHAEMDFIENAGRLTLPITPRRALFRAFALRHVQRDGATLWDSEDRRG